MFPRLINPHLKRLAQQYPVLTLTGPRQSGKTTLCKLAFPNHAYVNLEDLSVRGYATEDPKGFLSQFHNGVILDEIQRVPDLPSYIQPLVDENQIPGKYILTGSQQFEISNTINQSLAGRTAVLRLLPLSFQEAYSESYPKSLNEILYTGFYPRILEKDLNPNEAMSFYLSTYVERDIRSLLNIHNLSVFERFLKICTTQVGQLLNYTTLANDCGIDQKTVKSWLSVLEASYITFQIHPHFKSYRKRLIKSSKLYFYDVGLLCYLLGISSPEHIASHPLRGLIFENFVVSEFIKNRYNNVKDCNIYFYRDQIGNEVDLVLDYGIELVTAEIKVSQTINQEAFKGLNFYHNLAGDINSKRILIYAGTEQYFRNNTSIYSYLHLSEVFNQLPV